MAARWIALLRAIGPQSHAKMSMADLRAAAARAGLGDPRTVLATGNLLVTTDAPEAELHAALQGAVAEFGLDPATHAVILRRHGDLAQLLARPAFPDAAADRPAQCLVVFLSGAPDPNGLQALEDRALTERLALDGRELTIDYASGVGRSRLTARAIEQALGTIGTARNWTTIGKLHAAAAV